MNRQVSFDSRRAVLHWFLEHGCDVLCIWATVIRDRDVCRNTKSNTEYLTLSTDSAVHCTVDIIRKIAMVIFPSVHCQCVDFHAMTCLQLHHGQILTAVMIWFRGSSLQSVCVLLALLAMCSCASSERPVLYVISGMHFYTPSVPLKSILSFCK